MFSEISNLMYRFQMGIKEISPRFTRRNDSSLGDTIVARSATSQPRVVCHFDEHVRRPPKEARSKSLKIHYFELMLYKSIQIIVARLRLVIKKIACP